VIIVDTNVLSELMRPAPAPSVLTWLRAQPPDDLLVTAITLAEIAYGIELLPDGRRKELIAATALQASAAFKGRVLPFDEASVPHFARIVSARERAGRPMASLDGQIAAICAAHGAVLATRNGKDFEETGLSVVNPWQPE